MVDFAVTGTITLTKAITITNPNVIVDGSSAPVTVRTDGRGFTPIIINADNVTLKHLRIRPATNAGNVGDGTDGITITDSNNVLIDHCSISWGVDENLSIVRSKGITVRDCIVSEALYNSTHSEGPHSNGLLIADGECEAVIHRCLFAHNDHRNPVSHGRADIINTLVYAPGLAAAHFNDGYGLSRNNYIGNYLRFPDAQTPRACNWVRSYGTDEIRLYRRDNITEGLEGESFYVRDSESVSVDLEHYLVDDPFPMLYTGEILPAADVLDYVLANAGATPRDAVDTRIVEQVTNRTGELVDAPPD